MSVRRNGSAVSSLVHRMGEAREVLGRSMSEAALRSRCGPVLALVAWSGATPLEIGHAIFLRGPLACGCAVRP